MSAIVAEKNEFQRTLEQLNDWEKKSIAKVQQRAATLREKLLELTMSHRRQLAEKLQHLSTQIKDDDFTENDLRRWKKILDDLKKDYLSPSIISIDEYMKDPLVKDIYVASLFTNELFLKVSDENVRIEENGQLAIHNTSLNTTGIRGRNVYSTGCHQIRLRIEHSNNKTKCLSTKVSVDHQHGIQIREHSNNKWASETESDD